MFLLSFHARGFVLVGKKNKNNNNNNRDHGSDQRGRDELLGRLGKAHY